MVYFFRFCIYGDIISIYNVYVWRFLFISYIHVYLIIINRILNGLGL